jgi:steroid 5-alpha reductase family enzyme
MKIKHAINLHKGLTAPLIIGLMVAYDNFSIVAWIYLALHGGYGLLWLAKDHLYPDKKWEQEIPITMFIITFFILGLYWVAPYLLISRDVQPLPALIGSAIAINLAGIFLHYGSDAQKYFTLKYKPGLITEGFFTYCRNPNYLGEILIYLGFALLAEHWLPFVILGLFFALVFIPNMLKKDQSLSRYPGFADYKARTGLFLPKFWPQSATDLQEV